MELEEIHDNIIEGVDELLHGCFRFISHVGDAEGGAFDFPVSAIDEEVVFLAEGFDEGGDVESASCVVDGGQGDRAESFRGKVLKSVFGHPVLDHAVEFGVTGEAVF